MSQDSNRPPSPRTPQPSPPPPIPTLPPLEGKRAGGEEGSEKATVSKGCLLPGQGRGQESERRPPYPQPCRRAAPSPTTQRSNPEPQPLANFAEGGGRAATVPGQHAGGEARFSRRKPGSPPAPTAVDARAGAPAAFCASACRRRPLTPSDSPVCTPRGRLPTARANRAWGGAPGAAHLGAAPVAPAPQPHRLQVVLGAQTWVSRRVRGGAGSPGSGRSRAPALGGLLALCRPRARLESWGRPLRARRELSLQHQGAAAAQPPVPAPAPGGRASRSCPPPPPPPPPHKAGLPGLPGCSAAPGKSWDPVPPPPPQPGSALPARGQHRPGVPAPSKPLQDSGPAVLGGSACPPGSRRRLVYSARRAAAAAAGGALQSRPSAGP